MFRLQSTESRRLLSMARSTPGRPLLSVEEPSGEWAHHTAGDLAGRVAATARFLLDGGWEPGRHIVVALPNGEGLVRAVLASWTLGSSPLILPPEATDLERETLGADLGTAFTDALPLGERELATALRLAPPQEVSPAPEPEVTWHLPTGGTTGLPRLYPVVPGPGRTLSGVREIMRAAAWRRDAVQLSVGPLSHAAPLLTCVAGITGGAHVILPRRLHPASVMSAVERFRPTWCQLTPHQMALLDANASLWDALCSSLTGVLHTSAPCPEDVKRRWISRLGGDRVFETYSSTQVTGSTFCDGDEWLARPGTAGRPFRDNEVLIADPKGEPLPPGETGEVFMRSPWTRTFGGKGFGSLRGRGDGFFSIGDTGRVDTDGYLYLTGRLDDIVIVGGANVNTREVERVLLTHPGIADAVVVRRHDGLMGDALHTLIVPADPADPPGIAAVHEHCRGLISPHKIPMTAEIVDALPRSHAGKVERFLRSDAASAP
ncbi:class I adenylate-forming enzyme family protein [Actinomadura rugatobispora]|uniref:Class I adenylate-forming enzyme family protein n=1 Tax=Actinomadura rugatobispora TaxID=1994 RepID=A0ABW1A112_9ACTN